LCVHDAIPGKRESDENISSVINGDGVINPEIEPTMNIAGLYFAVERDHVVAGAVMYS
jgi:hypothetical protein